MLQKIVLQNYRCFESSEIFFRDTSILVGNNNAGKSTLIEALRIIGECAIKFKRVNYVQAPTQLLLPARTKGFYLKLDFLKIDLRTIVFRYKTDVFAKIHAYFDNKISFTVYLSNDLVFVTVESNGIMILNRVQARGLDDLELFTMPQIGLIREEEPLLSEETIKRDMSSRLSSRHFRNELYLNRADHFNDFRNVAQEAWPGLRINDITYNIGENIVLLVTDNDYAGEIGLMGSGLQMWLQIVWFISRCPSSATVVLDEPDVYMHPDLQRRVLNIVLKRFKQVIIATHSVDIISAVEPRQILTVDKKTRVLQYANNYKAVQSVISNLGSEHNLSLARLGNAKKCVFVEGKDISTLKKIQDILYPQSIFTLDQLPTVSLGGWSRYNEALGAARLFYEETQGQIKTLCILDRDYHSDVEVQKLYSLASENHLDLHIWKKKEIENYLLSPNALARVAGVSLENQEGITTFKEALFQELDKLAMDTKGCKLDELHKADRSKELSYFLIELDEWFSSNWSTLEGRLSVACGKDIISLVNEWIKSQYHRSCSRSRIISQLQPTDIPSEMKEVIDWLLE